MLRTPEPAAVSTPSTPQTFRTFVTGPQNALAYNVALTVARTPGSVYNPLYLSDGPGLGKSHLLQAIGAYLAPRLHWAEVLVLSAAAFAQEFAAHLRQGHMLAFRRRHRRAGALLLDDIALPAGRGAGGSPHHTGGADARLGTRPGDGSGDPVCRGRARQPGHHGAGRPGGRGDQPRGAAAARARPDRGRAASHLRLLRRVPPHALGQEPGADGGA